MTNEQTAIRHPTRGKTHRLVTQFSAVGSKCGRWGLHDWERLPLSQTAPEDRCKRCWKDAS